MSNALSVNEWPLWELINPSDPYTFRAPDVRVAGMAAFIMSHAYGAKRVGGGECSPIILGWDEWAAEHGIDEQLRVIKEGGSGAAQKIDLGGLRVQDEQRRFAMKQGEGEYTLEAKPE